MNRLISFDVGIKNLAYCVLDFNSESQNTNIVDWNILNLCSTEKKNEEKTCVEYLKSKRLCGRKAKYTKNDKCVCSLHAKQSLEWLIPSKSHNKSFIQKRKIDELKSVLDKEKISYDNLLKKDIVEKVVDLYKNKSWKLLEESKVNANCVDLISIGRCLHKEFKQKEIFKTITHVIIENQISPIANRMKTIQGMIAQYFIFYDIPIIEFISSSNKLKAFEKLSQSVSEYKNHKKDAVFYCNKILENVKNKEWLCFFNNIKGKKDDLADCFLQGIWYLDKIKSKK